MTLAPSFLKSVDDWRRKQRGHPTRAVAIRRLAERGLASTTGPPRKESKLKAAKLADREIERRLGDEAVSNEERARRKRQLIQGPREFRDIRANLQKTED
ncbi:MAG: hypothetical protein WA728_17095 [Xanthobacteraceae bacterium]